MFKGHFPWVAAPAALAAVLAAAPVHAETWGIFDVELGKVCWMEGYTNTAAEWTVTVTNDDETALVLTGSGVDFAPMAVASGSRRFVVNGGVRAVFTAQYGGGQMATRVKFSNGAIPSDRGDPALFHTTVGGEDGGDDDWQDLVLNVTCLHHSG